MPRRPSPDTTIGDNIRTCRKARGWSLRLAADRAGISHTTWSRIERGLLSADNRFTLAAIAEALECSITDLTGTPAPPSDRETAAAQNAIHPICQALIDIDLGDRPGDRQARPMPELERERLLVRDLWVRCDYAGAGRLLPGLMRELHAATQGRDRVAALQGLADVAFVASSTARHLGHPAEAWLAAERCRQAAEATEDPVLIGLAAVAHAQTAGGAGSYARSLNVATRAAGDLQGHVNAPGCLEVMGTLHLASANACLALKRPDDSEGWVDQAAELAQRTGETTTLWLWFGPTNINLWRISMEVDGGDPGRAVRIARDTNPTVIPAQMRQTAFHVDTARALSRTRQDREAVRHLLVAERATPQYVHSSGLIRETARGLLDRAGGPELRGLCERMGVLT